MIAVRVGEHLLSLRAWSLTLNDKMLLGNASEFSIALSHLQKQSLLYLCVLLSRRGAR